ncbi:MAG: PqqD family peptide modification chaperone [Anaerolineae bacterium]
MNTTESTLYIVNPDVSCREEGPDGALLFNPDTDAVLVINTTGLLIWEALRKPRDKAAVVAELVSRCNNVPADSVAGDVDEFVEQLVARGFVGIYQGVVQF